ncbi:MAG: ABC transporter substrate-binding protein [Rhodocyclales bacterium GT-UBC]|nr:MAG: ABC transporter substrate-binding protein [Rhodocyclales bacterium GT-UBC]
MIFATRLLLTTVIAVLPVFSAAADLMRISVSIPGPGAASYLPVELIPKIGADKAEGAELTVLFSPAGGISLTEMLSNNADFAVVGLPAAMSVRLKDPRVVALAAVNDLPLYVLLVRQGLKGKVKTIADLKGKTIGLHSNSATTKTTSQQVLELLLRRGGVPPDSYRKVSIGRRWESESSMLRTGTADAVIGDEPHATRMIEEKVAFPLVHLGDPQTMRLFAGAGFLRGTLVGRRDSVEKDPNKSETMVRILQRTLKWMASHSPEEIVDKLEITTPEERMRMVDLLRAYPRQYSKDGKFSSRQLSETEIFFIDSQLGNPAAESFRVESMIYDRWAGRKE